MALGRNKYSTGVILLLLGLVTLAVYWPVTGCDFTNFDDPDYVTGNPAVLHGLTWKGAVWAFGDAYAANWHPVTWLSHMLDVQLFGLKPGGHHLTNVLFHIANTLLLFLLLKRLTGAFWRSAFVAGLFALHPLHVESVAWVAERKDVLSTLFFMLTLWAYVRYVETSKIQSLKSGVWYGAVLGLFALGLMSKPMLVTLPFVLLLLDYWPLGRISDFKFQVPGSSIPTPSSCASTSGATALNSTGAGAGGQPSTLNRLLREKVPFLVLSVASCVITFLAQKSGGAVASLERLPFEGRLMNALAAYLDYIQKMVWPTKLAVLYLAPSQWPIWQMALAGLVLVGVTALVLGPERCRPYLAVGWLWYVGTLVPVIGLIQVGNQYMADRYTYIPLVGLFLILAWGGLELVKNHRHHKPALATAALLILCGSAIATRSQIRHWQDSETLFTHCVQVTTNNFVAHNNLGVALARQGRLKEAETQYLKALEIQPYYADALSDLGVCLAQQGRAEEAMPYLHEAVRIKPKLADMYGKLGLALAANGQLESAITYYREALRLKPDLVEALNNLAWIFAANSDEKFRDGAEAARLAERACELSAYRRAIFVGTLAAAYAEAGRYSEAVVTAEKARALALASGEKELAEKNRTLMERYQSHRAFHEPPVTSKAGPGSGQEGKPATTEAEKKKGGGTNGAVVPRAD